MFSVVNTIPSEVTAMLEQAEKHVPHKRKSQVAVVMIHATCARSIADALEAAVLDIRAKQTQIGSIEHAVRWDYAMTIAYLKRKNQ